jgi:hypothetical protein
MKLRRAGALLALVLMAAVAAGCGASTNGDKAGGGPPGGPLVLRMASIPWNPSDAPPVADFIRRVGAP